MSLPEIRRNPEVNCFSYSRRTYPGTVRPQPISRTSRLRMSYHSPDRTTRTKSGDVRSVRLEQLVSRPDEGPIQYTNLAAISVLLARLKAWRIVLSESVTVSPPSVAGGSIAQSLP